MNSLAGYDFTRYAGLVAMMVMTTLGSPSMAVAQGAKTATDPKVTAGKDGKPEAPNKVDVQPVARDGEISDRLEEILIATEWFHQPKVQVRDGVVFLVGVADQEHYRSWATDLAQRTQDVAAVVNHMTIQPQSIWNMSPAFTELTSLSATAIQSLPLILFGLIVIALTWMAAGVARRLASWFFRERIGNRLLRTVISQAMMLPVLLMGVYVVLRVSGLTQLALTVLGGTGIAGLIIGIAFRDIAENFLASILISVQNPFRSGDLIEVGEHLGFVQRVSTRGTLLMTYDGNHVQIPNATIYKSTIINYTANPNRRVNFVVGVGYDDSITRAQEVVKGVLDRHPSVLKDPESRVILDELGGSTVNLRVFVWLDALKQNPDTVRSSVMRMVKQSLLREGISLPDEAREVIFPNQVPVRMVSEESPSDQDSEQLASQTPDQQTKQSEPVEEVISAGEGSLKGDSEEIQRQAEGAWTPADGTDLLSEKRDLAIST